MTGEVGRVGISLVHDDQQLDHIVLGVHGSDVQWSVASMRPHVDVRRFGAAHQQLHDVWAAVLSGPVKS